MSAKSSSQLSKDKEDSLNDVKSARKEALADTLRAEELFAGPFQDSFDDWDQISDGERIVRINESYDHEHRIIEEEYDKLIQDAEQSEAEFEVALKSEEKIRMIVSKIEQDYRDTLSRKRGIFRGGNFSSRYASAGDLTFRISDHSMPIGGGYSEEMQGRHGCADYSLVVMENGYVFEKCTEKDTRREDVVEVASGEKAVSEFLKILYASLDKEIEDAE